MVKILRAARVQARPLEALSAVTNVSTHGDASEDQPIVIPASVKTNNRCITEQYNDSNFKRMNGCVQSDPVFDFRI